MINWGWNSQRNTSNSEYGRGAMFAASSAGNRTNYGGNESQFNSQMNANPYYTQQGMPVFTPGHAHSPGCPNFGAGQAYAHNPTCSNYGATTTPTTTGGGDTTYSGGGVYSTGGNSSTDFDVYVGDAAKAVMDANPTVAAVSAAGGSGDDVQGASPAMLGQQQTPQLNYNFYMPQNSKQSETGAGNNMMMQMPATINYQLQQPSQSSTGFGLPDNGYNSGASNNSNPMVTMKYGPFGNLAKGGKNTNSKTLLSSPTPASSKYKLCGSCQKCRGLKESGSSPQLFPPSAVIPQRRRNVNYVPNVRIGRNLAPKLLPAGTPSLQSTNSSHHKIMSPLSK